MDEQLEQAYRELQDEFYNSRMDLHDKLIKKTKPTSRKFPQCHWCAHYKELKGELETDWGGCVNPSSKYFGKIVFEHHHCRSHETEEEELTHYE